MWRCVCGPSASSGGCRLGKFRTAVGGPEGLGSAALSDMLLRFAVSEWLQNNMTQQTATPRGRPPEPRAPEARRPLRGTASADVLCMAAGSKTSGAGIKLYIYIYLFICICLFCFIYLCIHIDIYV